MKLPITDEFLWNLYNLLEETDEVIDEFFLSPSRRLKSLRYSVELDKLRKIHARKKMRKKFSAFVYYLKKRGYIKIKNLEGKQGVLLTRKGAEKVLRTKLRMAEKKKRRDGKWLMVIFDIPEKKRKLRILFREYLRTLGFQMLQRSVWVSPFDVFKEVEEVIRRYELDPYIKMFLIEEIEVS